jgi:hypothetical protein
MKFEKEKHQILLDKAIQYGYKAIEPYTIKDHDNVIGLLVKYHDQNTDNGTYYLEIQKDNTVQLRVETPNTIANFEKTQNIIDEIKLALDKTDIKKLNTYDFVTLYATLIHDTVILPLAQQLYPEDLKKQHIYKEQYMNVFLNDVLNYHLAEDSKQINEITINGKPYWFKQLIEEQYSDIVKKLEDDYEKRIKNNKKTSN